MKHKGNLILMERYHFFRSSCRQFGFNCKSLSELKHDEDEEKGALATVLNVLKQIHNVFFDVCIVFYTFVYKNFHSSMLIICLGTLILGTEQQSSRQRCEAGTIVLYVILCFFKASFIWYHILSSLKHK